ncbi:MAG: trypsin-like peptidase domain-containing protein [Gemmataceae bacterium]
MKRLLTTLLLVPVLFSALALTAQEPPPQPPLPPSLDPAAAVVRIKSHGASATIIGTTKDKSYILGCAHMLEDASGKPSDAVRKKKLVIDGLAQPHAPRKLAAARLLAWDHSLDLSLIEIDNGPFLYIPVAPPGHKPSRNLRSMGYDNMAWPITNHAATLLSVEGMTTYTREKPWHGRSGGGLIDCQHRYVIGVVQGYEVGGMQRGIYVSHAAIITFLGKHKPDLLPAAAATDPWPLSRRTPFEWCPPSGV